MTAHDGACHRDDHHRDDDARDERAGGVAAELRHSCVRVGAGVPVGGHMEERENPEVPLQEHHELRRAAESKTTPHKPYTIEGTAAIKSTRATTTDRTLTGAYSVMWTAAATAIGKETQQRDQRDLDHVDEDTGEAELSRGRVPRSDW